MTQWKLRIRWWTLSISAGVVLPILGSCPLSDRQLASVYQTVLTTGLTTLVTNVVAGLTGAGQV